MTRIAGVNIPKNKTIEKALTYIYGIGSFTARQILNQANISFNRKSNELNEGDTAKIREVIENSIKVEGDLRREVSLNIKRLMDLGCYKGLRHKKGLPVRGQRTHSNANTRSKRNRK